MMVNKIHNAMPIFLLGIVAALLAGCGGGLPQVTASPLAPNTAETPISESATIKPTKPTSTPRPTPTASVTPTSTATTDRAWHATALAVEGTAKALSQQSRNTKETAIAQFPTACDDMEFHASSVSPDGKWFAASCGYKRDQTLTVLDKEGTKWLLEFKDFLHPDSFFDGQPPMGGLSPKSWSPEGAYLYFISTLGYSGGGNECFPQYNRGEYGLFRLNLKTGSWANLISPTNSFPGYEIKFSPTGRRYAATINGVMITDLNTGEVTKIDVHGVIQGLIWSPDGAHLAYSLANCGEQFLQSSSVYVWDALTNQTQTLITNDEMLLRPELWNDNSTLRITGEKYVEPDMLYTVYVYDITRNDLVFTGTATPSP